MDLISVFAYIFTIVANSIIGLFVFLRGSKKVSNRYFALFSASLVGWIGTLFLYYAISEPLAVLFLGRLNFGISIYINYTLLMFVYNFPHVTEEFSGRRLELITYITHVIFILAVCTPLIAKDELVVGSDREVVYGELYLLYVSWFVVLFIVSIYLLVKKYIYEKGAVRLQILYLIWGFLLTFVLGSVTNLLLPLLGIFHFQNFGPTATIFLLLSISYVILKHRFLDLRFAVRAFITYLLVSAIQFCVYMAVYLFFVMFLDAEFNSKIIAFLLIASVVIVSIYEKMNWLVRKMSDKVLFSAIYDRNKLLRDLGMVLSSTVGFKDVLPKLYELLANAMHVKHVTFALSLHERVDMPVDLVQKKGEYALYHFGSSRNSVTLPSYLEKVLQAGQKSLLYDDLSYSESEKMDRSLQRLKKWMGEQEVGVVLPLYIKDDVIGFIIIGEKKNGDAFTSEDVGVLETFALQAAIGIENILLFMYSRDFNKQLSISVEQATVQLKEKNKTLELLRKMDSIITTTLEQDEVCQKVVDTLSWELGYDIAYLNLIDENKGKLIPRAVAHTPIGERAAVIVAGYEQSFEVDVTDQSHPIAKVFRTGTKFESAHLTEVVAAKVPDAILEQLHEIHQIHGVFVLPIFAKTRVIGTLIVTFPVTPDKISQEEREILDEFVKEVGIALDNAMLYEEVKRTNQALIDTNKRLIELDRMKDEFVSIASHELRTPMTAINSYVWMALNKGGELPVKARGYLDKVSISTQRLISLVEDMLNVSRIESGRVKIEFINFEMTSLIADVHEELQIKAHERSLELIFEKSEKEFLVHGDKNKTREVLTNLIGNALKFTDHGTVTTTVREYEGRVEISVSDTGRGIAESDMQRLFTKFGRLENELSTIAQTQGTGLGLYICKKYLEAMHGEIGVESKLGEGSRFWFRLPKGNVA